HLRPRSPIFKVPIHDQVAEAEKASTRRLRGSGSPKELPDVPGCIDARRPECHVWREWWMRQAQWEKRTLSASTVSHPRESPVLILVTAVQEPAATNWLDYTSSWRRRKAM